MKKMARCLELPDDVLQIIKDYARPLTRPDWRSLHLMPNQRYKAEYYLQYVRRRIVLYSCDYHQYNTLETTYLRMFNEPNFERTFGYQKIDYYINN